MGTNYYVVSEEPTTTRLPMHIGKSAAGWKFHFQELSRWDNWLTGDDINSAEMWFEILDPYSDKIRFHKFLIMDECDEIIHYAELKELIDKKQKFENNKDDFTYCKNVNGYRLDDKEFS